MKNSLKIYILAISIISFGVVQAGWLETAKQAASGLLGKSEGSNLTEAVKKIEGLVGKPEAKKEVCLKAVCPLGRLLSAAPLATAEILDSQCSKICAEGGHPKAAETLREHARVARLAKETRGTEKAKEAAEKAK